MHTLFFSIGMLTLSCKRQCIRPCTSINVSQDIFYGNIKDFLTVEDLNNLRKFGVPFPLLLWSLSHAFMPLHREHLQIMGP